MKKHVSVLLTLILLVSCLFPACVFALTEAEKDDAFRAALNELEDYLENPGVPGRSLDGCIEAFGKLGKYNMSDSFKRYAGALQMIEAEEFGRMLDINLKAVSDEAFASFIEEMDNPALGSPEKLICYGKGREAEVKKDTDAAMSAYEECLTFYDSADRYENLLESICTAAYENGTALYEKGDFAGAYFALQDCKGYELTDVILAEIVEELGYVPASATDNPCRHEWKAATCTEPAICALCGETDGFALGHKWQAATCTEPKTCTVCGAKEGSALGHDWQAATNDTPETCSRCGETRGEALPGGAVGDVYTFGAYEQDDKNNGKEPVEWLVLDVQGDKALLLSKYGLDAKPYNTVKANITWEKCTLRSWLNGEFYNNCFSSAEKARIQLTSVDNGKAQEYSKWNTKGGNNTQDKVFLLSFAEANKYFGVSYDNGNNFAARVAPTAYAKANGAQADSNKTSEGSAAGWWWLRSPGSSQNGASYVRAVGSLRSREVYSAYGTVRPALWVEIN